MECGQTLALLWDALQLLSSDYLNVLYASMSLSSDGGVGF